MKKKNIKRTGQKNELEE